jgi:hypothetical protein
MTALPAFVESTIATQVHGRFLVRPQRSSSSVIVGFHGYSESADDHAASGGYSWQ